MVDLAAAIGPRSERRGRCLPVNATWVLTIVLSALVFASFWVWEGQGLNLVFTCSVTAALGAFVLLISRRPLFAATVVASVIVLVNATAVAKLRTIGMTLHAYDIIFYLGSWSTISYLWTAAPRYVAGFVGGVALMLMLAIAAWRLDGVRVPRRRVMLGFSAAVLAVAVAGIAKPDRRQTQYYWSAMHVSSFYLSWAETLETLWRGQLIEAAEASSAPPFAIPAVCEPAQKPPHIVLVHQESIVQPSLFPDLKYDRGVDDFFRSGDGRLHKMRVETYGGASWLTEFSILSGLSTHAFGGMRPFVQSLLAGKVRDTLPEFLGRCGYRNVLFYPMLRNFVSNSRFYDAVGLREVYDMRAQGARSEVERDRFYYANALAEMERHVRSSDKPLFTFIQTMSAHWPYNYTYEPEMNVAGGGEGTDPEMHEYLRRLSIAKLDFDEFRSELRRRFPGEPILLVHYGDHHPMATMKYLGYSPDTEVEEVDLDWDSIGFITYYAVEALNFPQRPLPEHDVLDVPYLGAVILQQAGLPLSEPYKERLRLMEVCHGVYHGCSRRNEILGFHRRLIESNLIRQR
jgi:phosphoglycerol transferase MdoB-like AlkP superfamily enzyme